MANVIKKSENLEIMILEKKKKNPLTIGKSIFKVLIKGIANEITKVV